MEERKTGSASSSVEAQSHGAAGRVPLRELWEYVKPDMGYCREIVDAVQEQRILRAYTLDLMVQQSGNTDILELHDFFACGLYGFSDPTTLRQMALLAQRRLLGI